MAYTVFQMHQQFKDELDKVDSLATPNYLPAEIDRLLNEAQERFIKERLPMSRTKGTTVEETQRRRDDLAALVMNYAPSSFVVDSRNKRNGVFVIIPGNYKYLLEHSVNVSYVDECGNSVPGLASRPAGAPIVARIHEITHGEYQTLIRDPFWTPEKDEVFQLPFSDVSGIFNNNDQSTNAFEIISGEGVNILSYNMRFLREPREIDLANNSTCELGRTQAIEIVKMAVAEVEKIITDPRYQVQKAELAVTE